MMQCNGYQNQRKVDKVDGILITLFLATEFELSMDSIIKS